MPQLASATTPLPDDRGLWRRLPDSRAGTGPGADLPVARRVPTGEPLCRDGTPWPEPRPACTVTRVAGAPYDLAARTGQMPSALLLAYNEDGVAPVLTWRRVPSTSAGTWPYCRQADVPIRT